MLFPYIEVRKRCKQIGWFFCPVCTSFGETWEGKLSLVLPSKIYDIWGCDHFTTLSKDAIILAPISTYN